MKDPLMHSGEASEPSITIEMGGSNIVIRSTVDCDHAATVSLVSAVNAAAEADLDVVIDPESVRCDDEFASYHHRDSLHRTGVVPSSAVLAATGVVRLAGQQTIWTVDVAHGRMIRSDAPIDVRFLSPGDWTPVVAICVTPTRLIALATDRSHISEGRALEAEPESPPLAAPVGC